jgi:hypothetical protein
MDQREEISTYHSHNLASIFFLETVTLIRNSAWTEPSAGSWARKPDTHTV